MARMKSILLYLIVYLTFSLFFFQVWIIMRYFFILGEGCLAPQGCNPSVWTLLCVFGWLYLLPKKGIVEKQFC